MMMYALLAACVALLCVCTAGITALYMRVRELSQDVKVLHKGLNLYGAYAKDVYELLCAEYKHPSPHEKDAERRAREMDEGVDNILRFDVEHIGIRGKAEERDWDG